MGLKKFWIGALAALLCFGVGSHYAFASFGLKRASDNQGLGQVTDIKVNSASNFDGSTLTLSGQKCVPFGPGDFLSVASGSGPVVALSATSIPELKMKGSTVYMRWFDNATSKAQKRFRVPSDYYSGGLFHVTVGRTGTGAPPAIDFEVFTDRNLTAFDAAATDQTAVDLSTAIGAGSPEQKTLTVTTDFASLAAGDDVTVNFWRDNVNTSTGDLELYGGEFCYTTLN